MEKLLLFLFLILFFYKNDLENKPYIENQLNIKHIQRSTVSIIDYNNKTGEIESVNCTAFFISPVLLATAYHCIELPEETNKILKSDLSDKLSIKNSKSVVGSVIKIMTKNQFNKLVFTNGKKVSMYETTVIGFNEEYDVALLRLTTEKDMDYLTIAPEDIQISTGQKIYTMSMPRNQPWILSEGIISSLHPAGWSMGNILHQANISPGSSGSPLINNLGQVIAINSGYLAKARYISVAIPITHLRNLLLSFDQNKSI